MHATERSPCSIWSNLIHIESQNNLIIPNSAQLWNGETTKHAYSELIPRCHSMTFCQFQWDSMILYVFDDHDDHDDHVVACVIPSPCSSALGTMHGRKLHVRRWARPWISGIYRRCEDVSLYTSDTLAVQIQIHSFWAIAGNYKCCRMHLLSRSIVF